MTDADDPRLRFRVWVGGELVDETWVYANGPDAGQLAEAAAQRGVTLTEGSDKAGRSWCVEVYDPSAPAGQAYLSFGADAARGTQAVRDVPLAPNSSMDLGGEE